MGWQSGMNRLQKNGGKDGFVTGHDFSRADKLFILMTWASAPAVFAAAAPSSLP
jgi:hypothetical protein